MLLPATTRTMASAATSGGRTVMPRYALLGTACLLALGVVLLFHPSLGGSGSRAHDASSLVVPAVATTGDGLDAMNDNDNEESQPSRPQSRTRANQWPPPPPPPPGIRNPRATRKICSAITKLGP